MTEREPPTKNAPTAKPSPAGIVIEPIVFTPLETQVEKRRWRPSRQQWLIATPLFLGVLLVFMLLLSRSVTFATTPADTRVEVSGGLIMKLASAWLLFPGKYQVDLTREGYHARQETIQVGDDAEQQFQFEMVKLPGRLRVNLLNTQVDADILIDNKLAGTSANAIEALAPGSHQVDVIHPRYLPYSQSIVIEGLDTLQHLDVELVPAWANILVQTEPVGATLSVGQEVLGVTPGTFEILQGEQSLSLNLTGYKPWQDTLEFNAGEALELPTITLEKADGVVNLSTRPSGASVTVNGAFLGQTPLTLSLAPTQKHRIKIFKEGYRESQSTVSVNSGASKEISLNLEPALGKITITANVSDTELYVDGRLMGRANQTLSLPARTHTLQVKKKGFETFEADITPRPELSQQLKVTLRTIDQAKWDKIPSTIKAPSGQQLTLFKPNAQFTMGSSRREQGRRSNESLKPVALTRPFYAAPLLVTNRDFVKFEKMHSSSHVKGNSLFSENQPVVNLTWQQAAKYCNWLSSQEKLPLFYQEKEGVITGFNPNAIGYRLLTEAEWSWLARVQGKDGMRKYPWGNQLPPPANAGNYGDRSAAALLGVVLLDYSDGYPVTSPVGHFPPNEKGLYDMGGNASEWVNDYYSVGTGLSQKTETDPLGPEKGDYHVIRGSSWAHGGITELRMAYRDYSGEKRNDVGFRIARFVDVKKP